MDEKEFQEFLSNALVEYDQEDLIEKTRVGHTETFEEGMILTNNKGLTVTMEDGSKFQVTIVEYRR